MLGPADIAFFHGRRAIRIVKDAFVVDALIEEHAPQAAAVYVRADDTGETHSGAQRTQQGRDAAGAAQTLLAAIGVKEDYRCFLADSFGVAPHVTVEHQVADHEHPRLPESLDQID
jgi:hypothetical protein